MRTRKIQSPILTLLMWLLAPAAVLAQSSWNQQTACPGWNNPANFTVGTADFYYSGQLGERNNMVPDVMNGASGFTPVGTAVAASQLASATSGPSVLNCHATLPGHQYQYRIMTAAEGTDPVTGGRLPYVPTHLNTDDPRQEPYNTQLTHSIRIGDGCSGGKGAALRYTMRVNSSNAMLTLHYALVSDEAGHSEDADPVFVIRVLKEQTPGSNVWTQLNDSLAYYQVMSPNLFTLVDSNQRGWHRLQEDYSAIYYRDWDKVTIDLSRYLYEDLQVEVIVSDCLLGGHMNYAYIAGECRPMEAFVRSCQSTADTAAILVAPNGMLSYRWMASELGVATPPYADLPFRPLTDALSSGQANLYNAVLDDFRTTRRITPTGDTMNSDSIGRCQLFCCEMTSALDPAKPITSRIYIIACSDRILPAYDTIAHCDGSLQVANLSQGIIDLDTFPPTQTEWVFFADGDFSGTPLLTRTGNNATVNMSGQTRVGVVMRTSVTGIDCVNETRFVVHMPQSPQVQVSGTTHLYPGATTDLTALSNMPSSFQWSLTPNSVTGGFPSGPQLQTVPASDTIVYYIRAISLANNCETWDSITVTTYDTSRHTLLNHLFSSINIDTMACLEDQIVVSVGHSATCDIVVTNQLATQSHPGRVFLPDGRPCGDHGCSYRSPITFHSFAPDATVTSANDINHVRLNIEHSYIGDIYIGLTCPTGQRATLMKYSGAGSSLCRSSIPTDAIGWQGGANVYGDTYLGMANDNATSSDYCDSTLPDNAPGVGWNYCWSNSTTAGNSYAADDALIYRDANRTLFSIDSSNLAARTNFYHPDDHFNTLIGCPLNGTWYIEVIDGYSGDNGYIFDWELSLTATAIDSTINITSSEILGNRVARINDSTYTLSAPAGATTDTAITYTILLFDSLGIVADTTITIHYHAPVYTLIERTRCQGDTVMIDGIAFSADTHFIDTTYTVYGCQNTREVIIHFNPSYERFDTAYFCPRQALVHEGIDYGAPGDYTLDLHTVRDCDSTIHLTLILQDSGFHAAFELSNDGELWSADTMLAGCRPYTVLMHSLSPLASEWRWYTDGQEMTTDSVQYTYDSTGIYTITLIAASPHGCHDTLTKESAVWVFGGKAPTFTWSPEFPVMSHPTTTLFNTTDDNEMEYLWFVTRAGGDGYDTLTDFNPTYTWGYGEVNVDGDFEVTLQSIQTQIGPYGDSLQCTDSLVQSVTIISDYLQFPNLVTPNGDGVNDRWEVVNLIESGVYTMNELWIYNAWGVLVYHARDIRREEDFWDPNATRSPDGTYYYRFSAKSPYGLVRRQGAIEVVRN